MNFCFSLYDDNDIIRKKGYQMLNKKEIFSVTEMLPVDIKLKLIDKLLDSISNIDSEIESAWIKEVKNRKEEVLNSDVNLKSDKEIFENILKEI